MALPWDDFLNAVQESTLDDIVGAMDAMQRLRGLKENADTMEALALLLEMIRYGTRARAAILKQLGLPVTDITTNEALQSAAPFGYRVSTNGARVPIAQEEQIVTRARDLASKGLAPIAIATQLRADGYLNRRGQRFSEREIRALVGPISARAPAQAPEQQHCRHCEDPVYSREICSSHYQAYRKRVAEKVTSWEDLEAQGLVGKKKKIGRPPRVGA